LSALGRGDEPCACEGTFWRLAPRVRAFPAKKRPAVAQAAQELRSAEAGPPLVAALAARMPQKPTQ